MKVAPLFSVLTGLGLLVSACSSSTRYVPLAGNDPGAGDPGAEEDSDDPRKQPPHSLGVIVLGETHVSSSGKSTPVVSASFKPDARIGAACTTKIAGCDVQRAPKCTADKSSSNGCGEDETCVYDDETCAPTCKKNVYCEESCDPETEVCEATSKTSTKGKCVQKESFDAGTIAFSGTTIPITLHPPYSFESSGNGAPFLAGAEIKVQAQGATGAGFEKFEEAFTATTFLQMKPALSKIPEEALLGTGPLPLSWVPGNDRILVTIGGAGGTATCKAPDADGKFDVPREVIDAVLGEQSGLQTLFISVSRQRKDVKKDKRAKGTLSSVEVIPEGWLELVTISTETASLNACGGTSKYCDGSCVDVKTDSNNCGACGKTCAYDQMCIDGACAGCDQCLAVAAAGACKSVVAACTNNAACYALRVCVNGCTDQTCIDQCVDTYPDGLSALQNEEDCLFNTCYSVCQ